VINNCRLDLENYEELDALPQGAPDAFAAFEAPPEVGVDWHMTENQGRIGACNGVAGASCLERLSFVHNGGKVQLSDIFAYIASQKIGGLIGYDQGSRPTDFIRLATTHGVCPESLTGYPSAYPSQSQRAAILSAKNYAAGAPYKAQSVCVFPRTTVADEINQFIGGGGAVMFGIKWYSLIPSDRVVKQYAPPAGRLGGHANAVLGYRANRNSRGVNSWADGPYDITPKALEQMIRYPGNVFVGLMGNEGKPVDWVKDSPWNFGG
jgi:hypothetical protein